MQHLPMEVNKYKQVYLAASKNDVNQLNCLLRQEIEDGNLDDLLSKVCMELELNRVHLSDDIKQILERKLMSLRFFHKQSKFYLTSQEVRDHIQFTIQLISSLETCKDKDELFIGNLTFIAKQIFTLKRLLKSTYDRLPWEEIEFCILSYIRTFKDQNEIVLFSRVILSRSNMIKYLESFGKHLENLLNHVLIMRPQELSRLPNLKRDEVVEDMIDKYPEFKSLYDDHERIRDIHSLNVMLSYVELVRSIGLEEKNGIFILMRALQVIGEHLKNTLESPKLSQTTINYLFTFFSQSTRNLVINLRNTLAHQSLSKHEELLESNFLSGIKNDIEKLGGQIGYILSKYKMKVLIELGDKFLNTNDEKVMKEVASVMKNFGTGKVLREDLSELKNNDITRLKDLIDQYRCKIKGKCVYSEILFEAIDHSLRNDLIRAPIDYGTALMPFRGLYEKFDMMIESSHNKSNYIRSIKYGVKQTLQTLSPQIEASKLSTIAEMVVSIHSLSSGSQDDEVVKLFYKIMHIIKFEVNSVQWTEKFGRKIKKRDMEVETFNSENSEEVTKMKKQEKLNQLREIFDGVTYTEFKSNKKLQAVVEIFLLDLIPMLKYDHFKAKYFLNDNYPSLTGVDLRNHLAHNNVIVEVLLDSTSAIFLFVEKLLEVEGKSGDFDLTEVQYFNLSRMKNSYATTVDILNRKHNMFVALKENNFDAFSECIKEGADIRSRDTDLSTCLHFAMRRPKTIKLTKFLLKEGLSTFKMKNLENQSPLHIAVTKTNLEVVEFLLKNFDTDINEMDSFKRTPAHLAAFSGNEHILNSLWNHGADFTKKDYTRFTALQYAALSGKPSAVQFFFNKDLFYKLDEAFGGFTTLHIAADDGLVKIVNYLLSKNVKVDARTDVGATPLHLAALNGHLDTVKALIRAGADVNSSNMNGNCALHWACETGREEIVKVLIKNGADVNVTDHENNFAPINYLAKDGFTDILKIFLENGADVNVTTKDGLTPLLYAVEGRHLEIVDLLMQQDGIEVNRSNILRMTPLHGASMNGDVEIVRLLIMKGADLDCRNLEGMTPLHFACKHGHEAVVDLLIEHGVSIHAETSITRWLPLHMAAESGNENIMVKLIRKGSQINATTSKGANCLHIAVKNGRNILDLLIRFGVDIHAKTKDRGFTPLHEAVIANSLQMVKCLLNAGAHIDDQDNAGNTPIHLAIERDSNEISVFLFKNGARIDLSNKMDETPFLSAVKYNRATLIQMCLSSRLIQDELIFKAICDAIYEGNTNVFKLLMEHTSHLDLSVYCDEDQNTLLHIASTFGRVDIVGMMLDLGVVVDSRNKYGHTPLFLAVAKGCDEIVEMLLNKGATINPKDRDGVTPLHIVSETNHERMVEFLLSHGADVNVSDNKNRLPIELAVAEGRITSVKLFLEKNKSFLNRRGNQNFSLLHIATDYGHKEIVRFLLDQGADMHLTNDKGSKAIHIAAREGFTDIIDVFLEKGMDLDVRGAANQSMLHYAASTGRLEVVKYLLERGCDINTVNEDGISALHVATNQGHKEVVEYLLNNGAIYNSIAGFDTDHEVKTMLSSVGKLFSLIKDGDIKEIEEIIKEGVPLNCSDTNKGSVLHYAVYKGRSDVVELLLRNKVSTNAKHKNGWTPLHYAAKYSNDRIVFLLLWHGAKYNAQADNGKTPLDFAEKTSIRNLLQLINDSFESVRKKKISIIGRLKKIKDKDVVKAVVRAEDEHGTTLITSAIKNDFPKLEQLEDLLQGDVRSQMKSIDDFLYQERFQEGKDLLMEVYEKRREIFGDHNPATLSIKSKISLVLYKLQLYEQSLKCSGEICEKLKDCLGPDHKLILKERSSMALVLHRLGRNEESLKLFEEVHKIQKKLVPPHHQDSLNTIKHMAVTLMSMGELDRALKIYKDALKLEEKKYGLLHPYTLVAKNNIALILSRQGKNDEASALFKEVYVGRKLVLGKYHSDTLRTIHNQICVYKDQEKYDEALEAFKKLLKRQKDHLGAHHLDTLNTQAEMADLLLKQCKFFHAFKIFKEIKDHKMAVQGPDHAEVMMIAKRMEVIVEQYKKIGLNSNLDSFSDNLLCTMNKAARNGDIDTIEKLVRSGVDVGERDKEGRNCLHYAVDGNNIEVIKVFLKHGGDLTDKTNKGNTALHTACNKGFKDVAEFLLESVNKNKMAYLINAATKTGLKTALHVAAQQGYLDIVKLLLKKGAVYNCADKDNKKPLDLAQVQSVRLILELTGEMFAAVEKKDYDKISKLDTIDIDDFLCVAHAKNSRNETILKLLISNGELESARSLTAMIKKTKTAVRNL
ncbi:uncharacterized protein LOC123319871 [Coccinella septempunctata]|uniref:uncharacterized protein LOC123319871 n=1 Tax=Coccinella septempunctata TaxID=41139 RepID=UPI001D06B457|nr:uncharacterized protein LOC123319871 [Coccinella septempunctata]